MMPAWIGHRASTAAPSFSRQIESVPFAECPFLPHDLRRPHRPLPKHPVHRWSARDVKLNTPFRDAYRFLRRRGDPCSGKPTSVPNVAELSSTNRVLDRCLTLRPPRGQIGRHSLRRRPRGLDFTLWDLVCVALNFPSLTEKWAEVESHDRSGFLFEGNCAGRTGALSPLSRDYSRSAMGVLRACPNFRARERQATSFGRAPVPPEHHHRTRSRAIRAPLPLPQQAGERLGGELAVHVDLRLVPLG